MHCKRIFARRHIPPAPRPVTTPVPPTIARPGSPAAPQPRGWPVLRLGFRPFYLGAALFGALAVPLWMAAFTGHAAVDLPVAPLLWHAHEMVFGFFVAVIVGFLLTAGKAWTGLATPRGATLGALVALWLAARVAGVTGPYVVHVALDLALLPVVAATLGALFVRARNRRNMPLVGILLLLTLANLAFHLGALGVIDVSPLRAVLAGLALVVLIESVIAGRVIPLFTANATPGLTLRVRPMTEWATLALTGIALAWWTFVPGSLIGALLLGAAAALHLHRQWQWRPLVARGRPILWILHAAYVWIPAGLALLAGAEAGWIAPSLGVHALAVGATGGLIIGMMTRTARGHTGRPLHASRAEVLAYALVLAAALLRVLVPLAAPTLYLAALVAAAIAWSAAFALYLAVFAPWLVRTRADGKDG